MSALSCSASQSSLPAPRDSCRALSLVCRDLEGTPYAWGDESPDGTDCSGFVYLVHKLIGKPIPRTTARKYWLMLGGPGRHWSKAGCGDWVWWTLQGHRPYGHIGIMVVPPAFWQSGSSRGVYSRSFFGGSYWDRKFEGTKNPNEGDS